MYYFRGQREDSGCMLGFRDNDDGNVSPIIDGDLGVGFVLDTMSSISIKLAWFSLFSIGITSRVMLSA